MQRSGGVRDNEVVRTAERQTARDRRDNVREYFFYRFLLIELIGSGFEQHIIQWRV